MYDLVACQFITLPYPIDYNIGFGFTNVVTFVNSMIAHGTYFLGSEDFWRPHHISIFYDIPLLE
jgi:hypothetical protein